MMRAFGSLIANLRYLFVLAVLALVVLAVGSLGRGIVGIFLLWHGGGAFINPAGWMPDVVSAFIQGAFLYFLAVALCSLFIAEPPVPQWMQVRNLFQLRTKILTFLSFILPLFFLSKAIEPRASGKELLFIGSGVFLVLLGIFFLTRFGTPSGDEGMAREGNRVPEARSRDDRERGSSASAKASTSAKATVDRTADKGRRAEKERHKGSQADQDEWLKKQKEELKFQKDSLEKAVEKELTGDTGERKGSHVTVKPGPRRPRGRRR